MIRPRSCGSGANLRAQAVVGDDPRVHEVGHELRRHVAETARPERAQHPLAQARVTAAGRHAGERGATPRVRHPAVGGDVVRPVEVARERRARARRPASSTWTTCTRGRHPGPTRGPAEQRRDERPSAPGPSTGAMRSVVTETGVVFAPLPRAAARPPRRARRAGIPGWAAAVESSVSGTGLLGHAPYTAARGRTIPARRPRPPLRALRVPSTLTRAMSASSGIGSTTEARWTIMSRPRAAASSSAPATSTRWNARFRSRAARGSRTSRPTRRVTCASSRETREQTLAHEPRGAGDGDRNRRP